jgi:acetyltransferase-like isoleucine patch superfamily enzyme
MWRPTRSSPNCSSSRSGLHERAAVTETTPDLLFSARVLRLFVKRRLCGFLFRVRSIFSGAYVDSGFSIEGMGNVILDSGVIVHRRCEFTTRPGARLTIGAGTRIGADGVISVAQDVRLEPNVLIAARCYISDHAHDFEDVSSPVMHQGMTPPAPVRIGEGSWLGINVCILPGVTLGRNCVVGANSVVTRSVPDGGVVAGAPARLLRTRTSAVRPALRDSPDAPAAGSGPAACT